MTVNCVWEHNGNDTLLYAVDHIGAYTRGENLEVAKAKMPNEIVSYLKWLGEDTADNIEIVIVGEKASELAIQDADSDVLFESEKAPLTAEEYEKLKALALKSSKDFLDLYESIPDKGTTSRGERKTFYGQVPRSADEMYEHTKNVNEYYFAEIEVDADNEGNIYECRRRGFEALEAKPDFLKNAVIQGSYGEDWNLRKVLRRFIWHDRIHARAMWRMAAKVFGTENVINPFCFLGKENGGYGHHRNTGISKDRSASVHVTSFIKLKDDKIAAMDEYWADDGEAPAWRQEMKIGRKISDVLQIEDTLRLRRFDGDYDFAFEWYQDPETVLLVDGKATPYSYETLTNMYNYLNSKGELYFIEVIENGRWKPIGDVTFWQEDMPIAIGEREYRGKGIGKKVVSTLVERGRAMGYDKLYVGEIYDFNVGSQECFESVGFRSYEKTEKGSRYVLNLKE